MTRGGRVTTVDASLTTDASCAALAVLSSRSRRCLAASAVAMMMREAVNIFFHQLDQLEEQLKPNGKTVCSGSPKYVRRLLGEVVKAISTAFTTTTSYNIALFGTQLTFTLSSQRLDFPSIKVGLYRKFDITSPLVIALPHPFLTRSSKRATATKFAVESALKGLEESRDFLNSKEREEEHRSQKVGNLRRRVRAAEVYGAARYTTDKIAQQALSIRLPSELPPELIKHINNFLGEPEKENLSIAQIGPLGKTHDGIPIEPALRIYRSERIAVQIE